MRVRHGWYSTGNGIASKYPSLAHVASPRIDALHTFHPCAAPQVPHRPSPRLFSMATSPAPRLPVRPVLPILPVLIIGSGLGGLTLAQALAKHHIPFRIFERDAIRDQRFQGYRIRIHQLGLDALRECLPPRAFARFEETCAVNVKLSGRIDARTGQDLPGRMGPASEYPVASRCRVGSTICRVQRIVSSLTCQMVLLPGNLLPELRARNSHSSLSLQTAESCARPL